MFFSPIYDSFVLAMLIPLVAAGFAWVTAPGGRWDVVGLRAGVLVLLFWVLMRPTFRGEETQEIAGSVLVLMDSSRSMMVKDGQDAGGKEISRYEEMRRAISLSRKEFLEMGGKMAAHAWTFDEELSPVAVASGNVMLPETPTGDQTAIGWALENAASRVSGEKIVAVALLSDGAQRAVPPRDLFPQTAAATLARQEIPLYTVCFGRSERESRTRDLAVEDFLADQRVFVDTEFLVSGRIRVEGFSHEDIPVELAVENTAGVMEVVARTVVRTEKVSESLPMTLTWIPREPGEVKMMLRVPPRSEELSHVNNSLEAFVNVVKGGIPVLYVEGAFRPEMSFLSRSLGQSADIQLDVVRLDARVPNARPVDFAATLAKPYAAIILGDVDAACFSLAELKALADAVARGTGLLTLGGFQAYGAGGYAETPLAEVFPIRMDRLHRLPVNDPIPADLHWDALLPMLPTEAGAADSVMSLDRDPAKSLEIWKKLPPLPGANRFSVKPGAVVLAVARMGNREVPLLISQHYGQGRVMAFAADGTWRWWMHGHEREHKRFWRQVVLWLAQKSETLEGNVWISMSQRRFSREQRVTFHVGARLSSGEILLQDAASAPVPAPKTRWEVTLEAPDGTHTPVTLARGTETMLGTVTRTLPPGDYTIHAAVTHDAQKIGETRCRFTVFHLDLELDNAQANPAMMEALAVSTGGTAVSPAELPALWKKLAENTEKLLIRREVLRPLWDRWWLMLLMIGMLCGEWYVRKRGGMV